MPYIKNDRRDQLDSKLNDLISQIKNLSHQALSDLDGDLNYTITRLLIGVFDLVDNPKYTKFNTAIGVLEAVKLELYRRFIAPYEDLKISENGDIT